MNPLGLFLATRYGRGPRSADAIAQAQARGFRHLRQRIMPKSPFYAGYADRPLAEWPMMNKARLMEHFSAINTAGLSRETALDTALRAEQSRDFAPMIGGIAVGLSTGTSGQRGLFASDRAERGLWAALMLGRFMPSLLRRQRVAFFLRANNRLYESLSNPLIEFTFYDLLQPFEAHLAALARQRPTVLIAPAQILTLLARAQLAREIAIAPQVVIAVAEVASPEDAALVRQAFGVAMDQVYQCTEGVLGMTCRAGSLHLNEGFLHIERDVLDPETGAFAPIITDLTRRTLPILRYRLDDVLIPDPTPCPCGCRTLRLARIEGRCDDILYWRRLAERDRLGMVPSDALRQAVATARVPVRDYRAEQFGPDRLELWLDTDQPGAARTEITAALTRQAGILGMVLPALVFRQGTGFHPDRKRRRVISHPAGGDIR